MLIFVVFLVSLTISWFVKYPDVLKAEVVITTTPVPVNLVARVDGRLKLLKIDKETVKAGDAIAFIDGNVNLLDLHLDRTLIDSHLSFLFHPQE